MQPDIKQYTAADQTLHQFNNLFIEIDHKPKYYNYMVKYAKKSRQFELKSEDFLPAVMVNGKLQHKIGYHKQFKQAYGLTNLLQFETTIQVDCISYDTQDGYSNKLENDDFYAILLNFVNNSDIQASYLLQSLSNHVQSQACAYESNNLELIYLNHFRISLYSQAKLPMAKLTGYAFYPSFNLRFQEIKQSNKLVDTPLTRMITKPRSNQKNIEDSNQRQKTQYKFGFLTLDQSNRILTLMAQDPISQSLPLIGVWIYSNDPSDDVLSKKWLLWAIAVEFIIGKNIKSRISKDNNGNFLFIVFQKNATPIYFDIQVQDGKGSWKMVKCQNTIHFESLENHLIDFSQGYLIHGLVTPAELIRTDQKTEPRKPAQKPKPVSDFMEESMYECNAKPPQPTPLSRLNFHDSNSSSVSAHFANQSGYQMAGNQSAYFVNSGQQSTKNRSYTRSECVRSFVSSQNDEKQQQNESITEKLVLMQSEQLKMLQSQIFDLQVYNILCKLVSQKALISQQSAQNPMMYMQQMQQMQNQFFHQQNNSHQYSGRSTFKSEQSSFGNEKQMLKQSYIVPQTIETTFQKQIRKYPNNKNSQIFRTQDQSQVSQKASEKQDQEIEDIVKTLVIESKQEQLEESFDKKIKQFVDGSVTKQTTFNTSNQQSSDVKKKSLMSLMMSYQSPIYKSSQKQKQQSDYNQSSIESVKKSIQKFDINGSNRKENKELQQLLCSLNMDDDKENKPYAQNKRRPEDSTGSKYPRIKFRMNNSNEDSDSDEVENQQKQFFIQGEIKKLEMKYLKRYK